jgi:hypothetical protein
MNGFIADDGRLACERNGNGKGVILFIRAFRRNLRGHFGGGSTKPFLLTLCAVCLAGLAAAAYRTDAFLSVARFLQAESFTQLYYVYAAALTGVFALAMPFSLSLTLHEELNDNTAFYLNGNTPNRVITVSARYTVNLLVPVISCLIGSGILILISAAVLKLDIAWQNALAALLFGVLSIGLGASVITYISAFPLAMPLRRIAPVLTAAAIAAAVFIAKQTDIGFFDANALPTPYFIATAALLAVIVTVTTAGLCGKRAAWG